MKSDEELAAILATSAYAIFKVLKDEGRSTGSAMTSVENDLNIITKNAKKLFRLILLEKGEIK